MSKKGSNRNIYIFWGTILLVIIVVLLIIFLPRTNMSRPYNNMNQISQSIKKVDSHNKDLTFYAEQIIGSSYLEQTQREKTQALLHLQQTMELGTNYDLTALQFVENKKDFSALSNTQNANFLKAQKTITLFLEYCQNYVFQWVDGAPIGNENYFKQIAVVYIQKYQETVQQLADFYVATAEILIKNATCGVEVTELNLAKNQELMNDVKLQAYLDTPNSSQCRTIWDTAQSNFSKFN